MIYCCGVYQNPFQTAFLLPNFFYKDRKLEIYLCGNCGKMTAILTQYNVQTKQYETYKPSSRKKTADFIRKIKNGKFDEHTIKHGTKEKSGFAYGVNKQYKNGKIYQYSVNFNDEKKLVKVINLKGEQHESSKACK